MNLHEYQSKNLFKEYNIPIPTGIVCSNLIDAEKYISKILNDSSLVLKCQIHSGGRGKSSGIQIVKSKKEAFIFIEKWLGKNLITYQTDQYGQPVNKILIEKSINVLQELYLSLLINRNSNKIMFIASRQGGINIENLVKNEPNIIYKLELDPFLGAQLYQGRELAFKLGLIGKQINQFSKIFINLNKLFVDHDLSLIEINPLAINDNEDLICLDAKIKVDDSALFRQDKLRKMRDYTQENAKEVHAHSFQLNYISLDGNIGCMVNGAGLAMGIMDILEFYGGKPANFLDIGGSVTKDRVIEAFKIIITDRKVKVLLINIFGGIVRCDLIAEGIVYAIKQMNTDFPPVVVYLEGNGADLGIKIFSDSKLNIVITHNLIHAVKCSISFVRG